MSRINADLHLAKRLLDWLLMQWPEPNISLPDIYQRSFTTVRDKATAAKLVAILEDHGWLVRLPLGAVVAAPNPDARLGRLSGDKLMQTAYR